MDQKFGVDVGADRALVVVGASSHEHLIAVDLVDLPKDLLARVGDRRPCVTLHANGSYSVRPADESYAEMVERSLSVAGAQLRIGVEGQVGVALPTWWTESAKERTALALDRRGLKNLVLIDAASASVMGALDAQIELPDNVLVVDIGARSCSASVVSGVNSRPAVVPGATTVHHQGGETLDRLVFHQIVTTLGDLGVELAADDPLHVQAARDYLPACQDLRHELSLRSVVAVTPNLPGERHHVRFVREEFEELLIPWVADLCRTARTALSQSSCSVEAVLLVGGLANTPMICQSISAELELDVLTVPKSEGLVARGAALGAARAIAPSSLWARTVDSLAARWPRLRGLHRTPVSSRTILALPSGPDVSARVPEGGEISTGEVDEPRRLSQLTGVPESVVAEAPIHAQDPVDPAPLAEEPATTVPVAAPSGCLAQPVFEGDLILPTVEGESVPISAEVTVSAIDPLTGPKSADPDDEEPAATYDALNHPDWHPIPHQRNSVERSTTQETESAPPVEEPPVASPLVESKGQDEDLSVELMVRSLFDSVNARFDETEAANTRGNPRSYGRRKNRTAAGAERQRAAVESVVLEDLLHEVDADPNR